MTVEQAEKPFPNQSEIVDMFASLFYESENNRFDQNFPIPTAKSVAEVIVDELTIDYTPLEILSEICRWPEADLETVALPGAGGDGSIKMSELLNSISSQQLAHALLKKDSQLQRENKGRNIFNRRFSGPSSHY